MYVCEHILFYLNNTLMCVCRRIVYSEYSMKSFICNFIFIKEYCLQHQWIHWHEYQFCYSTTYLYILPEILKLIIYLRTNNTDYYESNITHLKIFFFKVFIIKLNQYLYNEILYWNTYTFVVDKVSRYSYTLRYSHSPNQTMLWFWFRIITWSSEIGQRSGRNA